jgi:hypothetical protein
MPEERFQKLTSFIVSYAKSRGLTPLALGTDRHGSWEWMLHWKSNDLSRHLALYLAENLEALGASKTYQAEVWAGADDEQRYARHPVSRFLVSELHLDDSLLDRLKKDLDVALAQAKSYTSSDLREVYLLPHG